MLIALLVIIILCLVIYIFYKQNMMTKSLACTYVISFRELENYPDLARNPHLKGKVKIISHTKKRDVYTVQTDFNDIQLKNILMIDYDLLTNQVSVQPGLISSQFSFA